MKKALVVFGSTSGNTAFLAQYVAAGLEKAGYEVNVVNVKNAHVSDFDNYDLVVLGSSTWDGPKQEGLSGKDQNKNIQGNLQLDMKVFAKEVEQYDFKGKAVAVFGVGHHSYTFTANAANLLEELVKQRNGTLVCASFRVTDVPDLYSDAIEQWASEISIA
jgi:flavodoxin I